MVRGLLRPGRQLVAVAAHQKVPPRDGRHKVGSAGVVGVRWLAGALVLAPHLALPCTHRGAPSTTEAEAPQYCIMFSTCRDGDKEGGITSKKDPSGITKHNAWILQCPVPPPPYRLPAILQHVLYNTIVYCTALQCTVRCCTAPYCTAVHSPSGSFSSIIQMEQSGVSRQCM